MKRIEALDVWRSFCIVLMVCYHALFDLSLFGVIGEGFTDSVGMKCVRYFCACSFILISGMVSRFSKDLLKRGFIVFCAGMAVTLATTLAGWTVAFGILQLLGVAMISANYTRKYVDKMRGAWFPLLCAALFALSGYVTQTVRVSARWLYPLGLRYGAFSSGDYYPLLPWIFLYYMGVWLGFRIREESVLARASFPRALCVPGRHSLLIYLAHQPVLYGACLLLWGGGK